MIVFTPKYTTPFGQTISIHIYIIDKLCWNTNRWHTALVGKPIQHTQLITPKHFYSSPNVTCPYFFICRTWCIRVAIKSICSAPHLIKLIFLFNHKSNFRNCLICNLLTIFVLICFLVCIQASFWFRLAPFGSEIQQRTPQCTSYTSYLMHELYKFILFIFMK